MLINLHLISLKTYPLGSLAFVIIVFCFVLFIEAQPFHTFPGVQTAFERICNTIMHSSALWSSGMYLSSCRRHWIEVFVVVVVLFPSQELHNDIPPLLTFNDTQISLYFCVMHSFHLFFFSFFFPEPDQIIIFIHFLSLHRRHFSTSPMVRVTPATQKSLLLSYCSIIRPHSFKDCCLYSHNLLTHIHARKLTFCQQSFIFSSICRLLPCLCSQRELLEIRYVQKKRHLMQRHGLASVLTMVK